MFLLPLVETLLQLGILRAFYGVGSACITSMMATVLADYPQERSRGKMLAFSGICNGLGAIVMAVLLGQMPKVFSNMGYDALLSGRLTWPACCRRRPCAASTKSCRWATYPTSPGRT